MPSMVVSSSIVSDKAPQLGHHIALILFSSPLNLAYLLPYLRLAGKSIALGRRNQSVAKLFLHDANIPSLLQQFHGITVAEKVRESSFEPPACSGVPLAEPEHSDGLRDVAQHPPDIFPSQVLGLAPVG